MAEPRVKTEFWAAALLRRWNNGSDLTAMLIKRGDGDAGAVILKVNRLDGTAYVLDQTMTADGKRAWLRATGAGAIVDGEAEAYIRRQLKRDPDLWVIEIEDRRGTFQPDEPVV